MEDPSRGTRFQDLLDLHHGDLIPVLGDGRKNAAVFLGRLDHGVTLLQRRSHGFLHDHVLSRFEGGNGGFRMDGRGQTDGDQIDVVAQKGFPEIFADDGVQSVIDGKLFRLFRIQIRQRPHLATAVKGLKGLDVDFGNGAGADDCYSDHVSNLQDLNGFFQIFPLFR